MLMTSNQQRESRFERTSGSRQALMPVLMRWGASAANVSQKTRRFWPSAFLVVKTSGSRPALMPAPVSGGPERRGREQETQSFLAFLRFLV